MMATGNSIEPSIVAKLDDRCGALIEKHNGGKTAPNKAPPKPYSQYDWNMESVNKNVGRKIMKTKINDPVIMSGARSKGSICVATRPLTKINAA